jgi:hypothetical protein
MSLFVDGRLVATNNNWRTTKSVTWPWRPRVLAVSCWDTGVVGGIIVSVSNGARSDSSWRCDPTADMGWQKVGQLRYVLLPPTSHRVAFCESLKGFEAAGCQDFMFGLGHFAGQTWWEREVWPRIGQNSSKCTWAV